VVDHHHGRQRARVPRSCTARAGGLAHRRLHVLEGWHGGNGLDPIAIDRDVVSLDD
jgi:hypothetical protein